MDAKKFLSAISNNIRLFRKQEGMRQVDLSNKVNINYRHLQKIESGEVDLKLSTLNSFSNALSLPACFLVESSSSHSLKSLNIGCPSAILDMLKVGIQVNDISGLVKYSNKTHAEMLGYKVNEIINKKYIWDFLFEQDEQEELKLYLEKIVATVTQPTPYYTKNRSPSGEVLPVKVDWNYIFDSKGNVIGFLSIITPHPSW